MSRPRPGPRRRLAAGFALLAAMAMMAPAASRAAVFAPESFTLENGLRVVVVELPRAPVVTHMVFYQAGAADERPGRSGAAHLLEHMMFKGTERVAPGAFSRRVAAKGGRDNAFTSHDYTGYFQTVAAEHLEMVMELEADRMRGLVLDPELLGPERQVAQEERRQRTDNNPAARLGEAVGAVLHVNHPYGTPVIGWMPEIAALDREALRAYYDRWYAPNNAILLVSGDVTAGEVRRLAERHYGPIAAREVPARDRPAVVALDADRKLRLSDPTIQQASWRRSWLAPAERGPGAEHAEALEVMVEILGVGSTSRLYRRLVREAELAAGVSMRYSPRRDHGQVTIGVSLRPEATPEAVAAAVEAEIAALLEEGVTQDELAAARDRLVAEAVYARDSVSGPASILGRALARDLTLAHVESWPERIAAVEAADIAAAAKHVFADRATVTGVLRPRRPARTGGDGATGAPTGAAPPAGGAAEEIQAEENQAGENGK